MGEIPQLASDDDGGDNRNARIRFKPPKEGDYQVVATRLGLREGIYFAPRRTRHRRRDHAEPLSRGAHLGPGFGARLLAELGPSFVPFGRKAKGSDRSGSR